MPTPSYYWLLADLPHLPPLPPSPAERWRQALAVKDLGPASAYAVAYAVALEYPTSPEALAVAEIQASRWAAVKAGGAASLRGAGRLRSVIAARLRGEEPPPGRGAYRSPEERNAAAEKRREYQRRRYADRKTEAKGEK